MGWQSRVPGVERWGGSLGCLEWRDGVRVAPLAHGSRDTNSKTLQAPPREGGVGSRFPCTAVLLQDTFAVS